MNDVLSRRRLNRATLARQWLLERAPARAVEAIEHLGGMQSQAPLAPYVGLWSRLRDFLPEELSALTAQRQVVRLHLMRTTVHLVSARDALDWRLLFTARPTADESLLADARALLDEKPRSRAELGKLLAVRRPHTDPTSLSYKATAHIPSCQVPPRGLWGTTGPVAWAPVESWLGEPLRHTPVDGLVLRYLGAFGPAAVADVQTWSGLTRLREVLERLPLRTFHDQAGRTLYDLPDAPRPAEDVPAPPRFLPEYDNLLLSYRDRTRVIRDNRPVPLPPGNGATTGTFLIDGMWQGTWRARDRRLTVEPFTPLPDADCEALLAEAARLATFLAPDTSWHIAPPQAG
jgi:hypothetical protein